MRLGPFIVIIISIFINIECCFAYLINNNLASDQLDTGSAFKEKTINLYFYEIPDFSLNKNFLEDSSSLNDRHYLRKQIFLFSSPESIAENSLQNRNDRLPIFENDELTYQPNRITSLLTLVGLGLISFWCLRIRMDRH